MGFMTIGLAVSLLGVTLEGQDGAQASLAKPQVMSLPAAAALNLVTVSIHGTSEGGSSGDVILLRVRRSVPRALRLSLPRGTVLRSASVAVQNMVVARLKGLTGLSGGYYPAENVQLNDDREYTYLVEAYCLDFDRENPAAEDVFAFDAVDADALMVLDAIPEGRWTLGTLQAALWLRVDIPPAHIRKRFRVADEEMDHARAAISGLPPRQVR